MKKSILLHVLSFSLTCTLLNAQVRKSAFIPDSGKTKLLQEKRPSLDLYATIPYQQCGAGVGMGIFGPSIGVKSGFQPIHLRLGGEFYFVELNHRNLGNVPLNAPQTGDAKVRLSQNNMGFNFVARFSAPYSQRVTPYADLFIGTRYFWTGMSITPNQYQEGYEESSSKSLAESWQFSYGASAGVLWGLGKNVKLNTGLMYTGSFNTGEVVDISNAEISSGAILTNNIATQKHVWILKVGFTFIIPETKSLPRGCSCDCDNKQHTPGIYSGSKTRYGSSGTSIKRSNSVKVNVRTKT